MTFRVWAPAAQHVYVAFGDTVGYQPVAADELVVDPATGHWTGFFPGVSDGTRYRYHVTGAVESELKRDPWARELEMGDYRNTEGIVRDPTTYPWHDAGFRPLRFPDLIVYQLHVGVFYARDERLRQPVTSVAAMSTRDLHSHNGSGRGRRAAGRWGEFRCRLLAGWTPI